MSYIDEIYNRLDIQQIREFLLHGVQCAEISDKTYEQMLKETEKSMIKIIQDKFPEDEKRCPAETCGASILFTTY